MYIWCLESPNKLKTEMYLVSESHEQVKFTYIHLVSINPEKLHPEMYIRCLEPLNKMNRRMDIWCLEAINKLNTDVYIWCLGPLNKVNTNMYIWCL